MSLSEKLKDLRTKRGLSQLDLSEKLYVSRQAVSSWEPGTSRPSTENLQYLSKLYGVPMEVLLHDDQEAEPGAAHADARQSGNVKGRERKSRRAALGVILVLLLGVLMGCLWFI